MEKISPVAAALSINPLFSGLGAENIRHIADLCVTQNFSNGETLFLKGDPGDALHGVRRGSVITTASTPEGKRITLNVLGSGDIFGEIALLDGRPRTADAIISGQTELFTIKRSAFLGLLKRQPEIALRVIELLCDRIRWTSERVEEAFLYTAPVRLARRLIKLSDDFGEEIQISQEDLSVLSGASRETVNRQLQKWRLAGIINLSRSCIRINNMARLREEADLCA